MQQEENLILERLKVLKEESTPGQWSSRGISGSNLIFQILTGHEIVASAVSKSDKDLILLLVNELEIIIKALGVVQEQLPDGWYWETHSDHVVCRHIDGASIDPMKGNLLWPKEVRAAWEARTKRLGLRQC